MGSRRTIPPFVLLILLTFLAFALCTFRLDYQSLWYDEGFSVYLAAMSPAEITARTAHDIHPPLYYFLLHFWILIFGTSEFSLRFLSAIFGVSTVPLVYAVGRRLLGRGSGLLAAALVAVSPLFLWYSQEARMYTLVTFLCLLSTYLLLQATDGRGRQTWLWTGYVLSSVAAVYAHFYAFFIVAFQAVFLLCWWVVWSRGQVHQRWPSLLVGILCQLAVLAAYLPWSGFVVQRYGADVSYWEGTLRVSEVLRKTLIMFSTGQSVLEVIAQPIAIGYVFVLLAALALLIVRAARPERTSNSGDSAAFPLIDRRPWLTVVFLLLYLSVPVLLLLLVSYQRAKFHPRYLMLASPAFFLLISGGMASILATARQAAGRRRAIALGGVYLLLSFVAVTSGYALYNAYFDINFLKDDFRSAVRYIEQHKGQNEVVILSSGHFFPVFEYYYHGKDWYPIPDEPTLSAEHVLSYGVADELNRILPGRDGVWLLLWQNDVVDPVGFLTMMLGQEGTLLPYRGGFWGLKLLHYALPREVHFSDEPEIEHPLVVNFNDKIQLLGYSVQQGGATTRGLDIVLYWQALREVAEDYKVSVRLRDETGHLWGSFDGRPVGLLYPTFRWRPDEKLFGQVTVAPRVGTPPAEYRVEVSLYSDLSLVGLDILDPQGTPKGTTASLGTVMLATGEAASLSELRPSHLLREDLGEGLEIVGYDLSADSGQPGDTLQLSLYWHARSAPLDDYVLLLQVYDEEGNQMDEELGGPEVVATLPQQGSNIVGSAHHLANRGYPTSAWRVGEVVLGQYDYRLPLGAAPGEAELRGVLVRCLGGLTEVPLSSVQGDVEPDHIIIAFRGPSSDESQILACRGAVLPSQAIIAPVRIEATERVFSAPEVQHRVERGNLGNKVSLYGYDLSTDAVRPGDTLQLTLYWEALDSMDVSYTVFTHLLDADNQVRAQMDMVPVGGERPTTGWVPQEYICDEYQLLVQTDASPGDHVIEVGMYDAATPDFQRLPLLDAEGNVVDNRIVLDTVIRVRAP